MQTSCPHQLHRPNLAGSGYWGSGAWRLAVEPAPDNDSDYSYQSDPERY